MNCRFFAIEADHYRCHRCGLQIRSPFGPDQIHAICRKPGWGDRLAMLLARIGLTQQRWQTRSVCCGGFVCVWLPNQARCGCPKRQQQLNSLGDWVQQLIRRG